jgi:hypothetical protein
VDQLGRAGPDDVDAARLSARWPAAPLPREIRSKSYATPEICGARIYRVV